jgi:hypothetical protein
VGEKVCVGLEARKLGRGKRERVRSCSGSCRSGSHDLSFTRVNLSCNRRLKIGRFFIKNAVFQSGRIISLSEAVGRHLTHQATSMTTISLHESNI